MSQSLEFVLPKAIEDAVTLDVIDSSVFAQMQDILVRIEERRNAIQSLLDRKEALFTERETKVLQQIHAMAYKLEACCKGIVFENELMSKTKNYPVLSQLLQWTKYKNLDVKIGQDVLQFKGLLSDLSGTMNALHSQLIAKK